MQNTSVLENHHWRSAIGCLLESGVSDQLPAHVRPELQRHISSLILATDITRQQEFLIRFKVIFGNNFVNNIDIHISIIFDLQICLLELDLLINS